MTSAVTSASAYTYGPQAARNPDLEVLLRQFFWPLMGVVFLSLLLPLGIKLVQMARRLRQGAAPA